MARTACSEPPQALGAASAEERVLLAWSLLLARRAPVRGAVAALAVGAGVALGWALFRSPFVALPAGAVMFSSVAEFLLPIRCRLTTRRAVVAAGLGRHEIAWRSVRRVVPVAGGVLLSPLAAASRLDAFRGVLLRFNGEAERDAALEIVKREVAEAHDGE